MKIHIKKSNDVTWCGKKYSIWREGTYEYTRRVRKKEVTTRPPVASGTLHTGTLEQATCNCCVQSFKHTAKVLLNSGTLQAFIHAGTAQHEG